MRQRDQSRPEHLRGRGAARPVRDSRGSHALLYGLAIAVLAVAGAALYRVAAPQAANAQIKVGAPAPDASFTTVDGAVHRLGQFRGRPVMLWLFATWCPTCQAGTAAVAQHIRQLEQAGLQVIQLKLYNNLGYPGPSVQDIAKTFAGAARSSPNWHWGEASQEVSYTYDPKGHPDIYFLIDKDGIIRAIDGGPSAAMDSILSFARQGR